MWETAGRPCLPASLTPDGSAGGCHPKGEEAPPGALTAARGASRIAPTSLACETTLEVVDQRAGFALGDGGVRLFPGATD